MNTIRRTSPRLAAVSAAALLLPLAIGRAQPPQVVRPLDPLTRGELALADSLVRAQPAFAALLVGRTRLVSTDFIALKGDEDRAAEAAGEVRRVTRVAELRYYVYERDTGVRALVDVSNRRVLETSQFPGAEAAISLEEVAEARRIAEADPAVQGALRRLEQPAASLHLDYYPARDSAAPDGCAGRRCLQLVYVGRRGTLSDPEIFVDLTSRRVVVRPNARIR
jgi:Cu2+-containing amine oxidase